MKRTTMRHGELMRLIGRLRQEQSRLDRHAKSLLSNDRERWKRVLDELDNAVEAVVAAVSVERTV